MAGPITNTMYSDFQSFGDQGESSQVGAPSATVECKLLHIDEEAVKSGSYRGEVSECLFGRPGSQLGNSY